MFMLFLCSFLCLCSCYVECMLRLYLNSSYTECRLRNIEYLNWVAFICIISLLIFNILVSIIHYTIGRYHSMVYNTHMLVGT